MLSTVRITENTNYYNTLKPAMDKLLMGVNYLYNGNVHSFPNKNCSLVCSCSYLAENSKLPEMSQKGM